MVCDMNTKAERLKRDLVYSPVPWSVDGIGNIAKYIRDQFSVSYYLSRTLADHVIYIRRLEKERLKDYIKDKERTDKNG